MQDLLAQITPDMLNAAEDAANVNAKKEEKEKVVPKEPQRRVHVIKPKTDTAEKKAATKEKKSAATKKKVQPLKGTKEITPDQIFYRLSSPWTRGMNRLIYMAAVLNVMGCFSASRKAFSAELFSKFYNGKDRVLNQSEEGGIFERTKDNRLRLSKGGWEYLSSQMTGSDIAARERKPKMDKLTEQFGNGGEGLVKV